MKKTILIGSCLIFLWLGISGFPRSAAGADPPSSNTDAAQVESAAPTDAAASAASAASAAPRRGNTSANSWIGEFDTATVIFGVAFLLTLAITGTMLVLAGQATAQPHIIKLSASFFFWLEMGYLVLLLIVAAFYLQLPATKRAPALLGDVLPIAVPWFGAVGAVVISLEGIFAYGQKDWDPKYNYWHIGRPLFGAVLGIVAFFTYLIIIMSAGATPAFIEPGKQSPPKDYIVYYIVAFLVGYREETFRELIRRVTDLILKPGSAAANAAAVTFKRGGLVISNLDFGTVVVGNSMMLTVDVENTGKDTVKLPSVSLDKSTAPEFTTANDKLTGVAELKPGDVKSIDIKFSPSAAGVSYTGVLTLTGGNLTTPAKLAISGNG